MGENELFHEGINYRTGNLPFFFAYFKQLPVEQLFETIMNRTLPVLKSLSIYPTAASNPFLSTVPVSVGINCLVLGFHPAGHQSLRCSEEEKYKFIQHKKVYFSYFSSSKYRSTRKSVPSPSKSESLEDEEIICQKPFFGILDSDFLYGIGSKYCFNRSIFRCEFSFIMKLHVTVSSL